jgi:hypothetical protein
MHVILLVFDLELVCEVPDLQGTDNGDIAGGGAATLPSGGGSAKLGVVGYRGR